MVRAEAPGLGRTARRGFATPTGKDLKSQLETVKNGFRDFRDNREDYDKVVWRKRPTVLQPSLQYSGDQYQTPDVEQTIADHVDVLMMNPTKIDAAPMDVSQSDTAKKKVRDIAIAANVAWSQMNQGRWWDAAVGTGQVRYGVSVMRLCWYPQAEYDEESDGKGRSWPFYWDQVNVLASAWTPADPNTGSPEAFWYEYERPLYDIQREVSKKSSGMRGQGGKFIKDGQLVKPALNDAKKLYWLGAESPVDGLGSNRIDHGNEKLTVIVRDSRDPEKECPVCPKGSHPVHTITEYIKGPSNSYEEMEEVGSYDSPFPGNSFFVIPGREFLSEANPHYRYRPMITALLVEAVWLNHLETVLAAMTQHDYDDENVYIDTSKVPPHVELPEGGKDVTTVFKKPKPGSGEIMAVPGQILAWPTTISPHLVTLRQECLARMERYRPNRFVTGEAFSEARYATGTAFLESTQQAKRPYERLLSQSDRAIKRSLEYCFHAIRRWDAVTKGDEQRKYALVASGNEHLLHTEAKRGEVVTLSADKLSSDFQLQLVTSNETLAEQIQREQQAWINFEKGGYDLDQLLRALGFTDPDEQKKRLRKAQLRQRVQPVYEEAQTGLVMFRMATVANVILPMPFSNAAQMQGPPGMGTPPNPIGAPGAPQVRTERLGLPAIQTPAMPGPTGGASPVAAGP